MHNFHMMLRKTYSIVDSFNFPPKKAIKNKDTHFVENRRRKLQSYLRQVVNLMLQTHKELSNGLDKQKLIQHIPFFNDAKNADVTTRNRSRKGVSKQPQC